MSDDQDPFGGAATAARTARDGTVCAHDGCDRPGLYPAPADGSLQRYLHFCLDHVREYNAAWRFRDGGGDAVDPANDRHEFANRATWSRPTWRPEARAGTQQAWRFSFSDPLDLFSDLAGADGAQRAEPLPAAPDVETAEALAVLDLSWPLEQGELRARFTALVKRFHPDTNRDDPQAETMMKRVNAAYHVLRGKLAPGPDKC